MEALKKAGELGFGAIYCSEEFGGSGLSRLDASVIFEQLGAGIAGLQLELQGYQFIFRRFEHSCLHQRPQYGIFYIRIFWGQAHDGGNWYSVIFLNHAIFFHYLRCANFFGTISV